jgi:hypothetical protein
MKNATTTNPSGFSHWLKVSRIPSLLTAAILGMFAVEAAFAEKMPRDFFAPKGIEVGTPTVDEEGNRRIPIKFETAIVHSAIWIDMVHTSVVGKEIRITADYRLTGGKNRYKGYIEPKGLAAGTYDLKYLDPNGKLHPIGPVTLP